MSTYRAGGWTDGTDRQNAALSLGKQIADKYLLNVHGVVKIRTPVFVLIRFLLLG